MSSGSGWLPGLDRDALRHELVVPQSGEPDWLALPARSGVALLEDSAGAAVLIATTADLRALARRRLGAPDPGAPPKRVATDVRGVVARIVAIEATSALEADAIYLGLARQRMPDTHRVVSERWRAWFVHADPDAPHPQPTNANLLGLVAPRSASTLRGQSVPGLPRGLLIGPVADKDTAGRLVELMIDAFDLCRYHQLLVQAPHAAACAYKEMGRCAAPCDGTEPMDGYRGRIRAAFAYMTGDRTPALRRLTDDMAAASAAHDFERAAAIKQAISRFETLERPAFRDLAELTAWRMLVVLPAGAAGKARCVLFAGATLGDLGLLDTADVAFQERASMLAERAAAAAWAAPPIVPTIDQIDTIAVVSRWLRTPAAKRHGEAIGLTDSTDPSALLAPLLAAVKSVVRPRRSAKSRQELEEREIEVLPRGHAPSGHSEASAVHAPGTPPRASA